MKSTKAGSKRRTSKKQVIILTDAAGNYYEVPRATLEKGRASRFRKRQIDKMLQDKQIEFSYIGHGNIPGSMGIPSFRGGRQLHYLGFYLSPSSTKR